MHYSTAITAFLGLSLVSGFPIQRRDASTILSDFSGLTGNVATLQSDVNSFTGTLAQALALASSESSLSSKVSSTTSDITNAATFSSADSTSVTNAIDAFSPLLVTLLDDIASKASVAASSGYTSIVLGAVKSLKTSWDALFAAAKAKVTSGDLSTITSDLASVDAAFDKAINAL